jgi:glycosyltransferase involved in cell wall biosynthesis
MRWLKRGGEPGILTIAIDLTPILPGGAKSFVIELVRQLSELAEGIRFILLTQAASHEELAELENNNAKRVAVIGENPSSARKSTIASRILRRLPARLATVTAHSGAFAISTLKRWRTGSENPRSKVDLLFCPFTAPTYFERGVPTVSIIYDLQHQSYPEFFSSREIARREAVFAQACRRSDLLIAISEFSRRAAIAAAGLDPARIKTVHLNISPRFMRRDDNAEVILERSGIGLSRYLIYPANFWKHKNHEMLLRAFAMARERGLASEVKLVCTGDPGSQRDYLQGVARNLNLAEHVVFTGYIADSEFLTVLANSAGLIFPSLYEGFGLPIVEAMAAGIPVACSNAASMPEVAGGAAILFDPRSPEQIAEAVISLVHDRELRTRLIEAGINRATQFSNPRGMAKEYLMLFQEVLRSADTVGLNGRSERI